jgi:AcrR family transcriptional regulator
MRKGGMTTQTRKRVRLKPEERRRQILDEAIQLIGQRGYYGFGIRELALRCNLTDAGLLHYFGSKDKLIVALMEDRDRRDAEVVTAAAGVVRVSDAEPMLTLRQVIDILHATAVRNSTQPELVRLYVVLQAEALDGAHPAHDFMMARQQSALDAFTRTVAPHVADPRSTALHLLSMMRGLEQEWLRTDLGFDLVVEWDRAAARLLPDPDDI